MTPCPLPYVGRRRGVFASDVRGCTVWDGGTRRVPLAGECPLCGAPTTIDTGALRTEPPLRVTASAATWSRYAGFFVPEDARDARLGMAYAPVSARGGSAPSSAPGGASRTEPPLRATASAAASLPRAYYPGNYRVITAPPRTHDICHVQVMTLCTATARKPAV